MESYIPQIIEEGRYATMLVRLGACHICKKPMVYHPGRRVGTFPPYFKLTFEAQTESAGFVVSSGACVDGQDVCKSCFEAGLVDLLCVLCNQRRASYKAKESFGDPPEYLCIDCYETVTARAWHDAVLKLEGKHRYDFE